MFRTLTTFLYLDFGGYSKTVFNYQNLLKFTLKWVSFIACELYLNTARGRWSGKNKYQSCGLMYVADLVNTFTFLESKFQASNKGHPLRWVDVLSVVWRVGRSDWNVNAVQRKHQIKSSDLFFHFMCEERLFSFSHCYSVGPERYHLGRRLISASMWVVGTVADLWRSPSV